MVISNFFCNFSKNHFPKDSESGLKSRKISNLSFLPDLNHPTVYTFLLWLITFERLELKQNYIPHLKVLKFVIDDSGAQWCGCISIFHYTHLKLALLLHKTALS